MKWVKMAGYVVGLFGTFQIAGYCSEQLARMLVTEYNEWKERRNRVWDEAVTAELEPEITEEPALD